MADYNMAVPGQPHAAKVKHTSGGKRSTVHFEGVSYVQPAPPPPSVARRNARERNRVKQVNLGFAALRSHLPPSVCSVQPKQGTKGKNKVSKVDTLKCAVAYIRSLEKLLMEAEACGSSESTSSSSMYDVTRVASVSSVSPSCSDASSPTPSYNESEHSFFTNSSSLEPYDMCDIYDIPEVPSEDELLDAIAWWQDSH